MSVDFGESFPLIILESAELSALSSGTRNKVKALQQQSSQANAVLKQCHAHYNAKLKHATQKHGDICAELDKVSAQYDKLRDSYDAVDADRKNRVQLLHESEAARDKVLLQQNDLKRRNEALQSEKDGLTEILARKQDSLTAYEEELQKLRADIQRLITEKNAAEMQVFDIESKERQMDARDERREREKQLQDTRMAWLNEEIERKDASLFALKSEHSNKSIEYETKINRLEQELRLKAASVEQYSEQQLEAHAQAERLSARVHTLECELSAQREEFERESAGHKEMIRVLESSAAESDSRLAELSEAVADAQSMHENTKQALLVLQQELDTTNEQHARIVDRKDDAINKLEDELKHANELLNSKHRVTLTDDEVAKLSPGAAAASRLIKSGITLTGIYREHIKTVEELNSQRTENERLESYFNELVQDIEQKAPILRQQREDYERALMTTERLRQQLTDVDKEQQEIRATRDNCERELVFTKTQLERYQRDAKDLNDQIRHLVRVIEMQRQGLSESEMQTDGRAPSPGNAVLFNNIDELQETNRRLMSDLREAQVKRDEMVKSAQQAEMAKLHADIDDLRGELQRETRTARERELLLTDAMQQRDRYKALLSRPGAAGLPSGDNNTPTAATAAANTSSTATNDSSNAAGSAQETAELRSALQTAEQTLADYKQLAQQREKDLNTQLTEQAREASSLRALQGKLDAELKYQQERFKALAKATDTYKKEVEEYKQRLSGNEQNVSKYEEKVRELTTELLNGRDEVVTLRVERNQLKEKLESAHSQVGGLKAELDVVNESERRHGKLIAQLKSLQERLSMVEKSKHVEAEERVNDLMAERDRLHKLITTAHEQHTQYINDTKKKTCELESTIEQQESEAKQLKTQLGMANDSLASLETKYANALAELTTLQASRSDLAMYRSQSDTEKVKNRLSYVEMQYRTAQIELAKKEKEISQCREEIERLENSLKSYETNATEKQEAEKMTHERLTSELDSMRAQIDAAVQESADTKRLNAEQKQSILDLLDEKNAGEKRAIQEKSELEQQLVGVRQSLEQEKARAEQCGTDRDAVSQRADELGKQLSTVQQQRAELESRLADVEAQLGSTKQQLASMTAQCKDAADGQASAQTALAVAKNEMAARQASTAVELQKLKEREDALLRQVQSLANQVTVLERSAATTTTSDDTANPAVDSTESATAGSSGSGMASLTETIQFLRKHKEDAEMLAEQAEAESRSLRDRLQQVEATANSRLANMDQLKAELQKMQEAVADRTAMQSRLQALQDIQQSADALQQQYGQVQAQLDDAARQLEETRATLAAEQTKRAAVEAKLVEANAELQRANTDVAHAQAKLKQAESEQSASGNQIAELSRAKTEAEARATELSTKLAGAQQEAQQLLARCQRLEGELATSSAQCTEWNLKFNKLRQVAQQYKKRAEQADRELKARDGGGTATATDASTASQPSTAPGSPATARTDTQQPDGSSPAGSLLSVSSERLLPPTGANAGAGSFAGPSAVAALQTKVNELAETQKGYLAQIESLTKEKLELTERTTTYEKELTDLRTRCGQADELTMRVKTLESRCAQAQDTIRQRDDTIQTLEREKRELEQRLQQARDQVHQQQQQQQQQQQCQQPVAQVAAQVQDRPAASASNVPGAASRRIRLQTPANTTATPTAKVGPTTVKSRAQSFADQGSSSSVTVAVAPMMQQQQASVTAAPAVTTAASSTPQAVVTPHQIDTAQQDSMVSGSDSPWPQQQQQSQSSMAAAASSSSSNAAEAQPLFRKRANETDSSVDASGKRSRTSPFEATVSTSTTQQQQQQQQQQQAHHQQQQQHVQPQPPHQLLNDDDDGVASSQDDEQLQFDAAMQQQVDEDDEDDDEPEVVEEQQQQPQQQQHDALQLHALDDEIDMPGQQQVEDELELVAAAGRQPQDQDDQVPSDLGHQIDMQQQQQQQQRRLFGNSATTAGDSEVPNQPPTFGVASSLAAGGSGVSSASAFGGTSLFGGAVSRPSGVASGGSIFSISSSSTFGGLPPSMAMRNDEEQPPEVNLLDSDSNEATSSTQAAVVPAVQLLQEELPHGVLELDDEDDVVDDGGDGDLGDEGSDADQDSTVDEGGDEMDDDEERRMREAAMASMRLRKEGKNSGADSDGGGVGTSAASGGRQPRQVISLRRVGTGNYSDGAQQQQQPSSSGQQQQQQQQAQPSSSTTAAAQAAAQARLLSRTGLTRGGVRRGSAARKSMPGRGGRQVYYEK